MSYVGKAPSPISDYLPPLSRLSMDGSENRAFASPRPLNAWGRNCSPLYPWLQPHRRIGINYLRELLGRSRARPLIQSACDGLTFGSRATVLVSRAAAGLWHPTGRAGLSKCPRPATC